MLLKKLQYIDISKKVLLKDFLKNSGLFSKEINAKIKAGVIQLNEEKCTGFELINTEEIIDCGEFICNLINKFPFKHFLIFNVFNIFEVHDSNINNPAILELNKFDLIKVSKKTAILSRRPFIIKLILPKQIIKKVKKLNKTR